MEVNQQPGTSSHSLSHIEKRNCGRNKAVLVPVIFHTKQSEPEARRQKQELDVKRVRAASKNGISFPHLKKVNNNK